MQRLIGRGLRDSVAIIAVALLVASPTQADAQIASWTQKLPAHHPSARDSHAMVYDAARHEVVLFGGYNETGDLGDTWVWDGTDWSERHPATSPSPRAHHFMAFDAARNQTVLFGGLTNDTWTWDGTNWTHRSPATSPPTRWLAQMAYDSVREKVVLFGGTWGCPECRWGDTWTWDGTTWTEEHPATSPPPNETHMMAFDTDHSEVVLFGGIHADRYATNETWTWNGTDWSRRDSATAPPPTANAVMAFDEVQHQAVMFGGFDYTPSGPQRPIYDTTWLWNGTSWSLAAVPAPTRPAARADYGLAYDAYRQQVVLFGGGANDDSRLGDTWVWGTASLEPTVTLNTPNGGERLFTKVATLVVWSATLDFQSFSLSVSRDGGATFNPIKECSALRGTVRSCVWNTNGPSGAHVVIRVSGTDSTGARLSDSSDHEFTVASPSIGKVSLCTKGILTISLPCAATWNSDLPIGSHVDVLWSSDGGETFAPLIEGQPEEMGLFRWTVAGPATDFGRIRVRWSERPTVRGDAPAKVQTASLIGSVGVGTTDDWLIDGSTVTVTIIARNAATSLPYRTTAFEGRFAFRDLPAGTYDLSARIDYDEYIRDNRRDRTGVCPSGGDVATTLHKQVKAVGTRVELDGTETPHVHIALPPPVVLLHGLWSSYKKWFDPDPTAKGFWSSALLKLGYITLNPSYDFIPENPSSWDVQVTQVRKQLEWHLQNLVSRAASGTYPPWVMIAHSEGGLVTRAMTASDATVDHRSALERSLIQIFLLGTPNGGAFHEPITCADFLSTEAIQNRFNVTFPNFADLPVRAYAGTKYSSVCWPWEEDDLVVCRSSALSITTMGRVTTTFRGGTLYASHFELGSSQTFWPLLISEIVPCIEARVAGRDCR